MDQRLTDKGLVHVRVEAGSNTSWVLHSLSSRPRASGGGGSRRREIDTALVSSTCAWRRGPAPVLFWQTTAENMRVTSHSILRYLTRADPSLGEAIVTKVQRMAHEAKPFKGDDARWHSETGLVLIVEDGVV